MGQALDLARPACMTLTAIAATALAACATPRTPEERAADAELAGRVQRALFADPTLYARHIDIDVERGVVHLGGYVWESSDYQAAQRDAAAVAGVRAVDADMELMRGGISGTSR